MSYLLEAHHLNKKYGDTIALQDFNIQIPKGSIYGLLGPNGAGKTTFIRMINQITQADSGEIFINGEKLNQKHISQIGYMPEERGLYKNMAIGEQCLYLGRLKGLSSQEAKKRLNYWFEKLEIEKWWEKKLSELSKGMAQKIQFVVTVLHNPTLLIFDEPFSGFDPINANIIRDEILKLKQQGKTIIFSTHRMESVEELCDNIALINLSKKVLDGNINDIRQKYKQGNYFVEIDNPNWDKMKSLSSLISIDSQTKNTVRFQIKMQDNNNELLYKLLDLGHIKTYKEIIPTMNDVFINAVKD